MARGRRECEECCLPPSVSRLCQRRIKGSKVRRYLTSWCALWMIAAGALVAVSSVCDIVLGSGNVLVQSSIREGMCDFSLCFPDDWSVLPLRVNVSWSYIDYPRLALWDGNLQRSSDGISLSCPLWPIMAPGAIGYLVCSGKPRRWMVWGLGLWRGRKQPGATQSALPDHMAVRKRRNLMTRLWGASFWAVLAAMCISSVLWVGVGIGPGATSIWLQEGSICVGSYLYGPSDRSLLVDLIVREGDTGAPRFAWWDWKCKCTRDGVFQAWSPLWPLVVVLGCMRLARALRREKESGRPRCSQCGYILFGSVSRCPECGTTFGGEEPRAGPNAGR